MAILTTTAFNQNLQAMKQQGATQEEIDDYRNTVTIIDPSDMEQEEQQQSGGGLLGKIGGLLSQNRVPDDPLAGLTEQQKVQQISQQTGKSPEQVASDLQRGKTIIPTTARIGLGFTPISPATEFGFETFESLVEGKDIDEALASGSKAAATDFALRVALGGAPAGTKALLGPKIAGKLDRGILGALGSKLFKGGAGKKFSQETVDAVLDNPELLRASGKSIDKVGKEAFNNIKNLKKEVGQIVGDAKEAAGISGKSIIYDDIIDDIIDLQAEAKVITNKGILRTTDENAIQAFKVIDDNLANKETIENSLTMLDNIDSSEPFQKIYDKMSDPLKSLTDKEKLALKARRAINEKINSVVDDLLDKGGLDEAKKRYAAIKQLQQTPELKSAFRSRDNLTKKIKQSLKEGNASAYEQLTKFNSMLLPEEQFMDNAIRAIFTKEFQGIPQSLPKLMTTLAGATIRPSAGREAVRGLARRGAVDIQEEFGGGVSTSRKLLRTFERSE